MVNLFAAICKKEKVNAHTEKNTWLVAKNTWLVAKNIRHIF